MSYNHAGSFDGNCWCDLVDYGSLLDVAAPPSDLYWVPQPESYNFDAAIEVSLSGSTPQSSDCGVRENPRKRGRSGVATKACRERLRREKLNDRYSELSAILEPGRPVKTDKLAILGDAIRVLKELRTESQEYTEMNDRLLEEIKSLKAEKNELREEKATLKADKERMEQQLKTMNIPHTGFTAARAPVYPSEINKLPMYPSYGFVPMWQYLPPAARDTSQDHSLRPPAA